MDTGPTASAAVKGDVLLNTSLRSMQKFWGFVSFLHTSHFHSSTDFLGSFKRNPAVWWPVAALSCSILFKSHIVQMCYGKTGAGCSRSAGLDSPDSDDWIGAHWVWEGASIAPCAQEENYGFCSNVGKDGVNARNFLPPSCIFPRFC